MRPFTGLFFKSKAANRAVTFLCNLPMIAPFAVTFESFHLLHHRELGIPGRDVDLPSSLEVRWVGRFLLQEGRLLLLFPVIYTVRATIRAREALRGARSLVASQPRHSVRLYCLMFRLGRRSGRRLPSSVAYFSVSLHPLAGRWIQEHFLIFGEQQTTSYYGFCNRISFNCGFHVEHHDLASIPWNRLRKLRRIASAAVRHGGLGELVGRLARALLA